MLDIRKPIHVVALLAILGVTAIAPTLASAKEKKVHEYTSTIQTTPLTTGNGYPVPGGTAVITGTLEHGCVRFRCGDHPRYGHGSAGAERVRVQG